MKLPAACEDCRQAEPAGLALAFAVQETDPVLVLFPERVERLGSALGVAERTIKVFCEADIRSHLVFQLSKLVSLLLKSIRAQDAVHQTKGLSSCAASLTP